MSTPTSEASDDQRTDRRSAPTLADLYRQATSRQGDRTSCPSADTLVDLERETIEAARKRELVEHLADCADCSSEFRALRRHPSREWPVQSARQTAQIRPFNRNLHRWSTAAAAAGVLLTAAIAIWQWRVVVPDEPGSVVRSAEEVGATEPPQDARLDSIPEALAWPGIESTELEASRYHVRLFDSEGTLLEEATVVGRTRHRLSETTQRALAEGGRFLWTVDSERRRVGPNWFQVVAEDG